MNAFLKIEEIQKLCNLNGIASFSELAEKAKIHRNTINNLIKGKVPIFSKSLSSIAKFFNISELELINISYGEKEKEEDQTVKKSLSKIAPQYPEIGFIKFGSRVKEEKGKIEKKYSDFDIGLVTFDKPLETKQYLKVKEEILESLDDFHLIIDVTNLTEAPSWFMKEITYQPEFLAGNRDSYTYFLGILDGIKKRAS